MAPNYRRPPPTPLVEDQSSDSSSGEEEEVESSSSEDEQSQPQINTQMATPKKPRPPTQQSDSDSESESESDSNDENDANVKPSTSKPLKETTTTSKKAAATTITAKKLTPVKVANEADKISEPEKKNPKKPLFSSSGEEENETSCSEDEQSQPQINTQMTTPKKPQPATQQSDSDSDSESESESESDDQPIEETTTTTKEAAATKKKSTAGAKRANRADGYTKAVKRAKIKESESEEKGSKRTPFERVWTDGDEVALLKGMIDFFEVNGGFEPRKDMNAFFNSVEKSISFAVTLRKFGDKLRKLRRKFERKVKAKNNGKVFEEPHDQKIFDLSNSIWGSDGIIKAKGKRNDNLNDSGRGNKRGKVAKKLESSSAEVGVNLGGKGPMEVEMDRKLTAKCEYAKVSWTSLASETKKAEFFEKLRKFEMASTDMALMRIELMQEKVKLVLEGFKAGRA